MKDNKSSENLIPLNYNINTIGYKNDKKMKFSNLKNNTFYNCKPKIKSSKSSKCFVPPPGAYYRDKIVIFKQESQPFNSSSEKKTQFIIEGNPLGPGQYKSQSYFDWNIKSFNNSYI